MQVVIITTIFETSSHVWRILTALTVVPERTSSFFDKFIFFPLSEGCYMLPAAIVMSVWMDVADSSASRSKVSFDKICHNVLKVTVQFDYERLGGPLRLVTTTTT